MKTSPLSLLSAYTAVFFLAAVFTDFSVDAAELSAATGGDRSAHSPSLLAKSKTLLSNLNPRVIYPTATRRDVAVTHPETGESLHGNVGQVERNLASRRLLINQDDAAKRVHDAITIANQAVKNGETSGVALPLGYVVVNDQLGGLQQLTVRLRLPGVDKDQNVLIDTGSSSLAFCDKSLVEEAKNISKTNYAQCHGYGDRVSCPDGSTGVSLANAGQVFRGDVGVYNDQGKEVASMDNVSFAIMDFVQDFLCFGPLDGIIGVAYKALSHAVELPSPDFNISSLWNESCPNPDQVMFSQGYETIGNCDSGNMTQVNLDPPLEQTLVQGSNSGRITAEAFGLYLDYAATIGSEVDAIVPSLGIYFGGGLAYDNQFYKNGEVQVAKTSYCGRDFVWYQLNFTSIRVPGFNFTQSTVDLCKECKKCMTDTGTSWIELPLSQDDFDDLVNPDNTSTDDELVDKLKESGSLFIDLIGADGDYITLSFPLLWLAEQLALGNVVLSGPMGDFTLGLPITQYYYTVYDMGNKTVSFVELNLSNETEAFIDGPELGGTADGDDTTTISPTPQPTSMGCFCHTIGLSLLAWTVFVPTAIAVITSL